MTSNKQNTMHLYCTTTVCLTKYVDPEYLTTEIFIYFNWLNEGDYLNLWNDRFLSLLSFMYF